MASRVDERLGPRLVRARERAGFSQEDVALLIGQPRTVISDWERGTRRPRADDLDKLAVIYRVGLDELLGEPEEARPQFEKLLFRDAGGHLDARGKFQLQLFLGFLDDFGELLETLSEPPGLSSAPFAVREGFLTKEDLRRRATEARAYLGIGEGPVGDLVGAADAVGITVYFCPLGENLMQTVSGAFVPHPRVGFSVAINALTTPGHRQFTLAHEIAHALFHGDHPYIGYHGRREAAERFANLFAAEFLVPVTALRARAEALGAARINDAESAVYLQRYFGVSYQMLLVRLRAAGLATDEEVERLKAVRPVQLAESLGYAVAPDEWSQEGAEHPSLSQFPHRFVRLLRRALTSDEVSVSRAAAVTGLAPDDIESFLAASEPSDTDDDEFRYLAAAG